jgi:hypothetical protein
MARLLRKRDFDVAGVKSRETGPVIGFVRREDLVSGLVSDHVKQFSAQVLISDGTPIPSVLTALKELPRVFVLIGTSVTGIATRADLNKPPVRIYLFSIVSLLEMHLTFWIRAEYPDDSWQVELSKKRLHGAKKLHEDRQATGHACDLVDCLQFCDKRDLMLKRRDRCKELGLTPKGATKGLLKKAEALRNFLAHSQQNLVEGSSWEELIDLVEWLEQRLSDSDNLVEKRAAAEAKEGHTGLWSSA